NLFGFSTKEKSKELAAQLPYLDTVAVQTNLPGTVVIKVQAATERYCLPLPDGQWAVLSDNLKLLKYTPTQPDGLIWLECGLEGGQPAVGGIVTLAAGNTAIQQQAEAGTLLATAESALYDANAALQALRTAMESYGLLGDISYISLADLSELSFLYQGRVSVRLGTANSLDYKLHLASNALLDADGTGIAASEHGTLDVSYQQSDGEIRGYFQLADPNQPEPAEEPAEEPTDEPPAELTEDTQTQ
ncbi:MAG: hypothetical protein PHO10_11630, partial [Gemmiger sp.]|nr:hypothetical protein [Gemmiger sp.]